MIGLIHWFVNYSVVIMIVLFTAIIVFNYWPSRRARIERDGLIPLKDDV